MNQDILVNIALNLSLNDIYHLCQSNSEYNQLLCNNQQFWREKYYQDFSDYVDMNIVLYDPNITWNWSSLSPNPKKQSDTDWKQLYINFGKTYGVGSNTLGQLGLSNKSYSTLTEITVSENQHAWYNIFSKNKNIPLRTKQVACGRVHTIAIDVNNYIWVFGNNSYHQMGNTAARTLYEYLTKFNIKAKSIACGAYHNLFIGMNDDLYAFGNNDNGQLGNDDALLHKISRNIYKLNHKVTKIACGYEHSMFIDMDNEVWVMGNNSRGQLGLGDTLNRYEPTKLGMKAKDIAGGEFHSILIDMSDNVFSFGSNEWGQLGLGPIIGRVTPTKINNMKPMKIVKCGSRYTMMIDMEGNLLGCGNNTNGELDSANDIEDIPIWISSNIKDIFCGTYHSLFITTSYTAYSMGKNVDNQLVENKDLRVKNAACGEFITIISTF